MHNHTPPRLPYTRQNRLFVPWIHGPEINQLDSDTEILLCFLDRGAACVERLAVRNYVRSVPGLRISAFDRGNV